MTLTISGKEYDLLCQVSNENQQHNPILDEYETLRTKPDCIGQIGYIRRVELMSGIQLDIINWRCDRNLTIEIPAHEHRIQFLIYLSGISSYQEVYPDLGEKRSYISGSGISPGYQVKYTKGQHFTGINVHIEPEVFRNFVPDCNGNTAFAKIFLKQDDWKESFYPAITPKVRNLVRQMIDTPYRGITKKLYLQGKVFELLAIQLDPIMAEFDLLPTKSGLKPQTIDRIYQARDILLTRIDNPPSILRLAQQVGISDRTLRSGFQELFGTTVIGYLTQKRLQKAELLLREKQLSVAEVANLVGYSHLGYFAKVFKRQFGITPSECLAGKKVFR